MADLNLKEVKLTQINERVSATEYNIIYPETVAKQVKTNEDMQFVSQAEKDLWNEIAELGLKYQGQYSSSKEYSKNDVVVYNNKYYIWVGESSGNETPSASVDTTNWQNLNKEAYKASISDKVKITEETDAVRNIALVSPSIDGTGASSVYYSGLTYDAKNEKINGTVDVADKYVEYEHTTNPDTGVVSQGVATGNTPGISQTIAELKDSISKISGGGTHLANGLTIKKDGVAEFTFDGTTAKEVDIKQTYAAADITDLLNEEKTKIATTWLPDSLFGQLDYQGTYNAGEAGVATPVKGHYYIVNGAGSYNPDGTAAADSYEVGDWAVYNGTSWDKIDNTDAVTMVNGQIGAVETYKGEWVATTKYFKGDIVKNDGKLYICNEAHTAGTTFTEAKWDLFGRSYTGDGIVIVNGDSISHKQYTDLGTETNITLTKDDVIDVAIPVKDNYGHVEKINHNKITLGDDFIDTTREIKVDGTTVLSGTGDARKTALDFKGDDYVNIAYNNSKLNINHKLTGNGTVELKHNGGDIYVGTEFTVPSIEIDSAGHVTKGELKTYKLADTLIQHDHFEVAKAADGTATIKAYDASTATTVWLANTANVLKFYKNAEGNRMNLNGDFGAKNIYQNSLKVLDTSTKVWTGIENVYGSYDSITNSLQIPDSGITEGVYSAVQVNSKGIAVAGGQIVEFGSVVNADPSNSLAVGGLFFRLLEVDNTAA